MSSFVSGSVILLGIDSSKNTCIDIFLNTGCITKIRTNFNLNFPLYCVSARGCCWRPRKSDASSEQLLSIMNSHSQNGRDIETKCGV